MFPPDLAAMSLSDLHARARLLRTRIAETSGEIHLVEREIFRREHARQEELRRIVNGSK